MEAFEANILLRNLAKRVRHLGDDEFEIPGNLTSGELEALQYAVQLLDGGVVIAKSDTFTPSPAPTKPELPPVPVFTPAAPVHEPEFPPEPDHRVELDLSVLKEPAPAEGTRLCYDFGTAMSKVTLVEDSGEAHENEQIEVLQLGVPGDQEEISESMLISSVFIDDTGLLWFGHDAVRRSSLIEDKGEHERIDNIKRYLSEEGLKDELLARFNPTDISVTNGEIITAYLMYLTWAVNTCLEGRYQRNLPRRFAMPCFEVNKSRQAAEILRKMLGEAQILADTFFKTLKDGIPLSEFMGALREVKDRHIPFDFVIEDVTEPLGVAGSLMSWKDKVNSLIMVVDVGAGTTDFSLYRMIFDPETGVNSGREIEGSSRCLTEAGNHLDNLLQFHILSKAEVASDDPLFNNIVGQLRSESRSYKETLFNEGELFVNLDNGVGVDVRLDEFLEVDGVKQFSDSLSSVMVEILNSVDASVIRGAPFDALGMALTGGGAQLPMVEELAKGEITIKGKTLRLKQTSLFPLWLEDEHYELEDEYPRIAVSLGGARQKIIERGQAMTITAGDVQSPPTLGGYYTKGN